jgi:glycosyltransferase involved in cell wall biosynthesis
MVIAINISCLLPEQAAANNYYLQQLFRLLIQQHPEHSFVLIVNKDFQVSITGSNVRLIKAGVSSAHPLRWKWWLSVTLPALLKKCGAELLVSAAGYGCLRTTIPQIMALTGLDFLYENTFYTKKQAAFFKKQMPLYLEQARAAVVFSAAVKADILSRYNPGPDKVILALPPVPSGFHPLDYAERQPVKDRFTGGKEYILYNGAVHAGKNLLHLLKAFSVFKKKQKTNMKLVFTETPVSSYSSFTESLQTYRYREDVLFTGPLTDEERAALTASAYSLVYPAVYEGMPHSLLEALLCGVPVICSPGSAGEEIAGEAGLYADPAEYTDIAEKMILLYKDENRRTSLVQQSLERAKKYAENNIPDIFEKAVIHKSG